MTPVGRMVLEPQPRQLLRRDRAGGLRRPEPGAGHRLLERPAARRAHPLLLRHPAPAARRAELPRDPDQRADRAGAQQPARRLPPPGHPSRPRLLRAQLARRRLPVPGGRARLHDASRSRSRTTRCAASPRSSRTTTRRPRCSGTARRPTRRRTSSAASASSSPRCRCRRFASARSRCCATSRTSSRRRWPTAWASPCPKPMPRVSSRRAPEVDGVAGAVPHRPARRRQHPRAQDRDPRRARRRRGLGDADAARP